MMEEFTAGEIALAIEAAGRRNIRNWDEYSIFDRLSVQHALRQLALEWLRHEARRHCQPDAGDPRSIAA